MFYLSRVATSYILFIYCFRESLLNKSYSVYPLMLTRNPEQNAIQIKIMIIETLNVTLVTYLGGFIQYWLHKIILVVL